MICAFPEGRISASEEVGGSSLYHITYTVQTLCSAIDIIESIISKQDPNPKNIQPFPPYLHFLLV